MKKLTKVDISAYDNAKKNLCKEESKITDRMTYIIEVMLFSFGKSTENLYWYFDGAEEGTHGKFDISDDFAYGLTINEEYYNFDIIDEDGCAIDLSDGFPMRWLTEDFEKELKDGIKLHEQEVAERKVKEKESRANKKKSKTALIESARGKLSKDELKALGLK